MPCIANDPENPSNFLRWHRASDLSAPVAGCLDLCNDDAASYAVFYDYTRLDLPTFLPIVNGDLLRFVFNSEVALDFAALDLSVGLLRNGRPVVGGFSQEVVQIFYGSGVNRRQRFYGSLQIMELSEGIYTPFLYGQNDPTRILYLANPLKTVNYTQWQRETTVASFRHSRSLAFADYDLLPADFYQQFRLPFAVFQPTYPTTEEKYTDRNGDSRVTEQALSRVYGFGSDPIRPEDFEAAVIMLTHDEIYFDGRPMRRSSALEAVEYFDDINALTVKGKLEDTNFARLLTGCPS